MIAYFGSAQRSNYYNKLSGSNIDYYHNFIQVDIDNSSLIQKITVLSAKTTPSAYNEYFSAESSSQVRAFTTDSEVVNLIDNYLTNSYIFYRHFLTFSAFYSVEPTDYNTFNFPHYRNTRSHFLEYAFNTDTLFKFDAVDVPVESAIFGMPPDFNLELAFVSYHRIPSTGEYFIIVYFPVDYVYSQTSGLSVGTPLPIREVVYSYHRYDIKKKLTNCCLNVCVEPNRYIFRP